MYASIHGDQRENFPSPACGGRVREGANSTALTRGESPFPNPPPQAGEGKRAYR
jgi:hypothetical protein